MKKGLKIAIVIALAATTLLGAAACGPKAKEAEATKYFLAHQGYYVGEAIVGVDAKGNVTKAEYNEWLDPTSWGAQVYVAAKPAEGDTPAVAEVASAIVMFPAAFVNSTSKNATAKEKCYFVNNGKDWVLGTVNADKNDETKVASITAGSKLYGAVMANPMYAEAYVKACKNNTLATVKVENGNVVEVAKAQTLCAAKSYKVLNKSDSASGYMPVSNGANGASDSIGFRENNARTLAYFKANPRADFASAKTITEAANFTTAPYDDATDAIWTIEGIEGSSGATWTDFRHYALELQQAYYAAIALSYAK